MILHDPISDNTMTSENDAKNSEGRAYWDDAWSSVQGIQSFSIHSSVIEDTKRRYLRQDFGGICSGRAREVGCGSGHIGSLLADLGFKVVLPDYSETALDNTGLEKHLMKRKILNHPVLTLMTVVVLLTMCAGTALSRADPVPVPRTGQQIKYSAGDDGDLRTGSAWPSPRFSVHSDTNCVLDNLTGLVWFRNAGTDAMDWETAREFCSKLNCGGYTDWRLPSRQELLSLIDNSRFNPALCDAKGTSHWSENDLFTGVSSRPYWTGTTAAEKEESAWHVLVQAGVAWYSGDKTRKNHVWPVRSGNNKPVPVPRFTIHSDTNCVVDNLTGLMWARNAGMTNSTSWEEALAFCNRLTYGGYDDWRLPNMRELLSLIDDAMFRPAVSNIRGDGHCSENDPFTGIPTWSSAYWTSTTVAGRADSAWYIGFGNGLLNGGSKTNQRFNVWPVR